MEPNEEPNVYDPQKNHDDYKALYKPNGPYSFSQLSLYEDCPRKYWLRYVACVESDEEKKALKIGKAVHEAVERGMEYLKTENPDTLNIVEWYSYANAAEVENEVKVPYKRSINSFMEWLTPDRWNEWKLLKAAVDCEFTFGLTEDWEPMLWSGDRNDKPKGMIFRGAIDLSIIEHRRLFATIIDLKTGKNRYEVLKNNNPSRQLALYAFVLMQLYPHLQFVLAAFFNLMFANETEPLIVIDRKTAEVQGRQWIERCVNGIRSRKWRKVDEWEPKSNEYCYACEYKEKCPLYEATMKDPENRVRKYKFNEFSFLEASQALNLDDEE